MKFFYPVLAYSCKHISLVTHISLILLSMYALKADQEEAQKQTKIDHFLEGLSRSVC